MFHLSLFRNRAFAAGNAASLLASVARGGLQFMLIIWLQGIWLPLHGYDYADTPLWAGIFLLPMTAGFLLAGPLCGWLSDRYGARFFTTGGLVVFSGSFVGLLLLPITFPYWAFALLIMANGMGSGMFSAPNTSAIMSSVPVTHRGAASGMRSTFQNSGMSLSIGIFFSLMIVGLADRMPAALSAGLQAQGVPAATAAHAASLPPVSTVFSAFLGINPVRTVLGPDALGALPAHNRAVLTGKEFFPHLIAGPFHHGLLIVFATAAAMGLLAATASLLRGATGLRPGQGG
jgi:MFS family permease